MNKLSEIALVLSELSKRDICELCFSLNQTPSIDNYITRAVDYLEKSRDPEYRLRGENIYEVEIDWREAELIANISLNLSRWEARELQSFFTEVYKHTPSLRRLYIFFESVCSFDPAALFQVRS